MVRWLAVAAITAFFLTAGSAAAQTLPSSPTPLPGSGFQGGDGDQDDGGGFADWQGLRADGRVTHSPDPNAEDSAFAGGTKEDLPGGWKLTTERDGVTPDKANILDAFSVVSQPGADTFLYLGFTREAAGGTTYVAFELNQDARLWTNNEGTRIPCRRTGDVLVVLAAHGSRVDLVLEQWQTAPGATDADTGCATAGTLRQVVSIPAGAAQGDVNDDPIISRLPGAYAPGEEIDDQLFAETALNLSRLLNVAFAKPCFNFGSIWMHSRSSLSETSNMQDYVAPRALAVRKCTASGVKFFDLDADGVRDRGEPGIPRFVIWADYDDDGVRDDGEPFTVTDRRGRYVLADIRPTADYRLRETLLPGRRRGGTAWRCSFPNADTAGGFSDGAGGLFGCGWGPISVATTPYARGRDFGDWLPAYLTLKKRLLPTTDEGVFDLRVNGTPILRAAEDGATTTIQLDPGSYDIDEVAVPPTDAAAYRSSVRCRATPRRRGRLRSGTEYLGLVLRAGAHATCTFVNARQGAPGLAIEKVGPRTATAGDTLEYTLHVTNVGDVPFAADAVTVEDTNCDEPPVRDDGSPATLDPGDTWIYRCSHQTTDPGEDCALSTVVNTATASGSVGGTTVTDSSTITTTLLCPDRPPEPPLPPVDPPIDPPAPGPDPNPSPDGETENATVPPGPEPPPAGQAGRAGLRVLGRCVARVSQVRLVGTRIARAITSIDGRRVSRQRLRVLQRNATPLNRVTRPGPHRVVVRVTFQHGSGTPPVRLARTIRVCGRVQPRFTG